MGLYYMGNDEQEPIWTVTVAGGMESTTQRRKGVIDIADPDPRDQLPPADDNSPTVTEVDTGTTEIPHAETVEEALLHAAEEALEALTRNHNDEVQGDWNLADGHGLDDEVMWLTEAIAKAKGGTP